ncbi:MAG: asparagine synthase-related protein [Planctomycetota bacterium]
MCGIVGIREDVLSWTGGDFDRAVRALEWRGPDGSGTAQAGAWRLGVTRLAITDAATPQPIRCPRTGHVVVFNGAVTSAEEEWARFGAARASDNDAELPLLRLAAGGPQAIAPRCGHHALALVEGDGRGWLARDRFGEKPLYVVCKPSSSAGGSEGGRVVAFASTVVALRMLGFGVELDEAGLRAYFERGWHGPPVLVGSGNGTHGDAAGLELHEAAAGVVSMDSLRAVPQAGATWPPRPLRARVQAAVERCARAEVPVGLSLSGGIDSACIAACLHRAGRGDVLAFQFRARGTAPNERDLAEGVAQASGLTLVPVDAGPELLGDLLALTRARGLPVGDPSTLAAHAVARAAARTGVRVLLSGEGGDEMFFGYRRYRAMAWLPWARWLPAPSDLAQGTWARLRRAAQGRGYDALLAVAPPGVARRALVRELWPVRERLAESQMHARVGATDSVARAVAADREGYLRHDLLPKLDLATMAAAVEARAPFLDPEVVAAPETDLARARRDLGKRALRAAFAAELPGPVLAQGKTGFGLPLDRWLREDAFLPDLLRDRRTLERPHVVARGLTELLDRHRRGRAALGHALYLFAAYEVYLRVREEAPCAG